MNRRPRAMAVMLVALLAAAGARAAEVLRDPTRPPEGIALAPGEPAMPQGPVLQSVLVAGERSLAVIDGVAVTLGGRYGDAKLAKVGESEVVLRGPRGTQVLRLYPAVELKRVAGGEGVPPAPAPGKKK